MAPSAREELFNSISRWRIIQGLYGNLSGAELFRFMVLGLAFFFVIGGYWLLRPLKDGVFFAIVGGREYQPRAKMLSVVVVVLVAIGYGRAVTALSRRSLFVAVCLFFAAAFAGLSLVLGHPTIGLPNDQPSPDRLVGWASYFIIETYGSLVVSMFWSYVASTTSAASAGRGFSIVIGCGNVGAIVGPLLAVNAEALGIRLLFFVGTCSTLMVLFLMLTFDSFETKQRRKEERDAIEEIPMPPTNRLDAGGSGDLGTESGPAAAAAAAMAAGDVESGQKRRSVTPQPSLGGSSTAAALSLSTVVKAATETSDASEIEELDESTDGPGGARPGSAPPSSGGATVAGKPSLSGSTGPAPGARPVASTSSPKPRAGFFDGLLLLVTRPYLTGIFLVSTLYEVIATITDYQMKVLAHESLKAKGTAGAAGLSSYLGMFGVATNSVALVLSLVGTSYFMRRFGLRACLLAYPASVAMTSTAMLYFAGAWEPADLLSVTFVVMVLTKGLSYALNNPAKEMMYIPTSTDMKFKAKSWVDLFGMRTAKATGSLATNFLKSIETAGGMMQTGAMVSLVIVGVWSFAADYVGRTFQKLVAQNETLK